MSSNVYFDTDKESILINVKFPYTLFLFLSALLELFSRNDTPFIKQIKYICDRTFQSCLFKVSIL